MKFLNRLFSGKATGRQAGSLPGDVESFSVPFGEDEAPGVQQALAAADVHNAEGHHARALACIDRVLARWPGNFELLAARGTTLYEWGRAREALDDLRRCALLRAADQVLAYKLGWTCLLADELGEALHWMRRAVEVEPTPKTHFGLAIALEANGLPDEAIDSFRKALDENEFDFACLIQYGLCLMERRRLAEAESLFRRATEAQPESPVGWTNLGVVLSRQRRRAEALAALMAADRLEATTGESANNFANLAVELSDDGRLDEALAVYERHLPTNPLLAAHFGYAGALIRAGRMEEGWIHYEYRLVQECPLPLRDRPHRPAWSGQDLAGRTILVEAEQGYGDTIQFARYGPLLKSRGATVILRVLPALARLARGFRGIDRVVTAEDALPEHDFRVHMLSLPRVFCTDLGTIPGNTPYLRVDERRRDAWRERLHASQRINVGLVWAGNPNHTRDEFRSIELNALAPLGRARGVRFVSLQKGDPGVWGSDPPPGLDLADFSAELRDFEDTTALIDALDLVISVDTAVLHLSGALAKPTWALLTAPPDFRWMDTDDTTAWYPTMRLFRQRRRDDWGDAIDRVSRALEAASVSGQFRPDDAFEAKPTSVACGAVDPARDCARTGDPANRRLFVVAETRYGMMQYRPDDLPVGKSLDRYGEYLQLALDALGRFLRPGMIVVESNAGIGAHSVPLACLLGAAGHLVLYEEDALSRLVLQHNLRIAGATNVTIMRVARGSNSLDDLGLRTLDLFKANGRQDRGALEGAARTLRRLRPAVFLESADRASLADVPSRLEALDYNVRCLAIPYFDPNNFRGSREDAFQGRRSFVMLAIPRERDTS